MSDRQPVPMDRLSGTPLPLVPNPDLVVVQDGLVVARFRDMHHDFWPRRTLMEADTSEGVPEIVQDVGEMAPAGLALSELGKRALRGARVEEVNRDEHDLYHSAVSTPALPMTELDLFSTVVFCAAGYMPSQGVMLDPRRGLTLVPLSTAMRGNLWGEHGVHVEHTGRVRQYLLHYAVLHGLNANERIIDEFLHTANQARRIALGRRLVRQACEEATVPLRHPYKRALQKNRLPYERPQHVGEYVFRLLADGYRGATDGQALAWLRDSLVAA